MIVIGVDVHKQSLTAAAVDETGRPLGEQTVGAAGCGGVGGLTRGGAAMGARGLPACDAPLERRLLEAARNWYGCRRS